MDLFIVAAHNLVNLFAGGRSTVKLWWLLILLISSFLIWRIYQNKSKKDFLSAIKPLLFISGFGFLLGIIQHFYLLKSLNLPFWGAFIFYANNEISSTSWLHLHEQKVGFGFLLEKLGFATRYPGMDAGFPYLEFLPQSFAVLSLIVFVLLVLGWVYFLKNANLGRKELLLGIFGFFILSKNIIDGGLLNYEVPALLIIALLIFLHRKYKNKKVFLIFALVCIFSWLVFFNIDSFYFTRLSLTLACYLALVILFTNFKIRVKILAIFLPLFLWGVNLYADYSYLFTKVDDSFILLDSSTDLPVSYNLLYEIGQMKVVKISAPDGDDLNFRDIIKSTNLVLNHHPILNSWLHCNPQGGSVVFSFEVFSDKVPKTYGFSKDHYLEVVVQDTDKENKFLISLASNPCTFINLQSHVEATLSELDLMPAIVINNSKI